MTDDLKRILQVAADFAVRRGEELPTPTRVELVQTGIFKTYDFESILK